MATAAGNKLRKMIDVAWDNGDDSNLDEQTYEDMLTIVQLGEEALKLSPAEHAQIDEEIKEEGGL